jgi:hypothetical protein
MAVALIGYHFPDSREEDIGLLVAGWLLAVFLASVGASLYNKTVDKSSMGMQAHVSVGDIDDDEEERPLSSRPERLPPAGFTRGVRVGMPLLPASGPDLHLQVSPWTSAFLCFLRLKSSM